MVGRKDERARLKALLDAAREGRSGTLLLHGPPGIGKTALLRWTIEEAADFTQLRARGMESESDIPFAGLAELILVGEATRPLAEALGDKLPVTLVANAAEAADALLARLAPGDAVLVKASNGIGLASLVERVAGGRA